MKKTIVIFLISLIAVVLFAGDNKTLPNDSNDYFIVGDITANELLSVSMPTSSWCFYLDLSDSNSLEQIREQCDYLIGIEINGKEHNFTLDEVLEKLIPNDDTIVISEILRVYDGDTFYCNINKWPPILGENIGIRVNGIDTPEMRGSSPEVKELALQAKAIVHDRLTNAEVVVLKNIKRGKYFRVVADVEYDGQDLAKVLIEAGLAKRYDGGTKDKWTIDSACDAPSTINLEEDKVE